MFKAILLLGNEKAAIFFLFFISEQEQGFIKFSIVCEFLFPEQHSEKLQLHFCLFYDMSHLNSVSFFLKH